MKKYCTAKIIVPALFVILGILWLVATANMSHVTTVPGSGPQTFPNIILIIMSVCAFVVLIQEIVKAYRSQEEHTTQDRWELIRVLALAALLIVYGLAMKTVGFVVCSLVLVESALLLFGQKKPLWLILLPIVSVGLLYVIFRFGLKILLPTIWLP